jgi:lambda repressor-like predicted transcriptional regulator
MTTREQVRGFLKANGLTLKDLSKGTGINYDRLVHILNGFRPAKIEESEEIDKFMEGTENG